MTFRLAESSESCFQASMGRVELALTLRRFIHSDLRGPLGGSSARLGVSERHPLCQGTPWQLLQPFFVQLHWVSLGHTQLSDPQTLRGPFPQGHCSVLRAVLCLKTLDSCISPRRQLLGEQRMCHTAPSSTATHGLDMVHPGPSSQDLCSPGLRGTPPQRAACAALAGLWF